MGIYDNKEGQSLDMYEGEDEKENIRYVSLFFLALPPLWKESNHPTGMGKRIKSLNYFVYIPKIGLLYNC